VAPIMDAPTSTSWTPDIGRLSLPDYKTGTAWPILLPAGKSRKNFLTRSVDFGYFPKLYELFYVKNTYYL
jgi:hypothetical protein